MSCPKNRLAVIGNFLAFMIFMYMWLDSVLLVTWRKVTSWLTAAIPLDTPYCSCKGMER